MTAHAATLVNLRVVAGTQYTLVVDYRPVGPNPRGVMILLVDAANNGYMAMYGTAGGIDLGSVVDQGWTVQSHSIQELGDGFYRATLTGTSPRTSAGYITLYLRDDALPLPGISYTGLDDGSGIQFRDGSTCTIEAYEGVIWPTADATYITADSDLIRVNTVSAFSDAAVFSGSVLSPAVGTFALTEAADTAAFAGLAVLANALQAIEGPDTASFAGTAVTKGTIAAVEAQDSASFAATAVTNGVLAATEASDIVSVDGLVGRIGTLAVTEGADTATFSGSAYWDAVLAATDGSDTASFAATALTHGTINSFEDQDVPAFVGDVLIAGTFAAQEEEKDVLDFVGERLLIEFITLDAVETDPDAVVWDGWVAWAGTLAVTEGADECITLGFVSATPQVDGVLATVEQGSDTAELVGVIDYPLVTGAFAATEVSKDVMGAVGFLATTVVVSGTMVAFETQLEGLTADSTFYTADNTVLTADMEYILHGVRDGASFTGGIGDIRVATMDATEGETDAAYFSDMEVATGELVAVEEPDDVRFSDEVFGAIAAQEEAGDDTPDFRGLLRDPVLGVLAVQEAEDIALLWGIASTWTDIQAGLEDEVERTLWLENLRDRTIMLGSEVEDTTWLQNLNARVVYSRNEQQRITGLLPKE